MKKEGLSPEKRKVWDAQAAEVDAYTDGLGQPVDEGVKDLVIVCNLLGLPTDASCEGHIGWGTGAPYVDFKSHDQAEFKKEYDKLSRKMNVLGEDGMLIDDREKVDEYFRSDEFKEIRTREDESEALVFAKVLDYVQDYYAGQPKKDDSVIIFSRFRIENEGVVRVPAMNKEEQREFLRSAQTEFAQFTDYLVQVFEQR